MGNYDLMISSAWSKVLGKISTSCHYMLLGALRREPQFNAISWRELPFTVAFVYFLVERHESKAGTKK